MDEKYISKYDTELDYLADKENLILPHVSLIESTMEIKYDSIVEDAEEVDENE